MTTTENESVLLDIEGGQPPLTFDEVRRHPLVRQRGRKPPDLATIFRWAQRGVNGVRLEYIQRPGATGGRATTRGALLRFFERLTAVARGEAAPTGRSPRRRQRDLAAAENRLAKAGL